MNTKRHSVNWISALLYILMLVAYFAAPFYHVLTLEISGYLLMSINMIAIVPVLLGILAAVAACIFPPVAAIITEIIHLLVTLLFMCIGNTIASSLVTTGLNIPAEWAASVNTVLSAVPMVQPGWGAIVCLLLCIAAIAVDVLVNWNGRKRPQPQQYIIGQDMGDPFNTGMF